MIKLFEDLFIKISLFLRNSLLQEVSSPWSTERRKSLPLRRTVTRRTVLFIILCSPFTYADVARCILVFIASAIGTDVAMISGIFVRGHSFIQLHSFLKISNNLRSTRCSDIEFFERNINLPSLYFAAYLQFNKSSRFAEEKFSEGAGIRVISLNNFRFPKKVCRILSH